jgi:hypothetical protein
MTPLRREVERLLEAGNQCGVAKTEGTCQEILKRREALWTFVQVEGVEPPPTTQLSAPFVRVCNGAKAALARKAKTALALLRV